MPSRNVLVPINPTKAPSAEDVNIIYNILNGYYDSKKGHGMSVKLTAYDGRLSTSNVNTTAYALEVRHRHPSVRRTAVFRDSTTSVDSLGDIIAEVRSGLLRAVDPDSATPTTPAQVIVHGTPAGGILTGTYPNPSASSAITFYPTMIVAWYGSAATTPVGGQLEVAAAPGWVFCNGLTYNLYAGGTLTTPNMADRLPIGVGTVLYKSLGGNSWATAAAVSIAHTHTMTHEHTYAHTHTMAHEHTAPNHAHGLHDHTHGISYAHTHGNPAHAHDMNSHTHGLVNHTHTGNTLSWPHEHNHKHPINDHSHGLDDHDHDSGTYKVSSTDRTGDVFESGSGGGSDLDTTVNLNHGGTNQVAMEGHTHEGNSMDIVGKSNAGHFVSSGADFHSTSDKTSMETQLTSTAVSSTGAWTGTTNIPSPNTSDVASPTSTANDGGTTTASQSVSSGTSNAASPTTTGAVGTGAADGSGATTGQTVNITAGQTTVPGGLTTNITVGQTNNITAGQAGLTTVNAQPPVLAWHWIMKL